MDAVNLATTEELVAELRARANFRGVVMWQPNYNGEANTSWQWHSMNCDAAIVCREIADSISPQPVALADAN